MARLSFGNRCYDAEYRSLLTPPIKFVILSVFLAAVLFTCDFEDSCVDDIVQESRSDDLDFELGNGWQGDWYTGPEADHTLGNSNGMSGYLKLST